MNRTKFLQTGGWPLNAERLEELQTSYSIFNALGAIAGNLTIISGCEPNGTVIENGVVFINGEVLEFREADASGTPSVIIIEENVNRPFQNTDVKTVHTIRYATFGTDLTNSWLWSDFIRPPETKTIPSDLAAQLAAIGNKEEKTVVTALAQRILLLEQSMPKIRITYGTNVMNARTLGLLQNDFSKNWFDVAPPSGYGMSHLVGFMPSIAEISFSGDVNQDDTLWCKFVTDATKIRVICSNSETRADSRVNWMAVWIKY